MQVGILGYCHLGIFGVLIPYLVLKSARALKTRPLPPKAKFLRSQIVILFLFFVFSAFVARSEWIRVFPRTVPDASMAALGAALLVALLILMRPIWRRRVEQRARATWLYMPRTRQERVLWVGCSIAAGISEEVTYRGVMFAILWRLSGSALAAALIAAAVFSISHAIQGGKSMAIIFGFALAFQALAWMSGSLYVSMAVHALYDVAAGLAYGAYGEKLGYPIEPMPA